jgi:hypothetical protein
MQDGHRLEWLSCGACDYQGIGTPENSQSILACRHCFHRIQFPGAHLEVDIEVFLSVIPLVLGNVEAGLTGFDDRDGKADVDGSRFISGFPRIGRTAAS